MNKKVTITEIVATKIIYAIILVSYYWMWARTDWKDYYQSIQVFLGVFLVVFFLLQYNRIKKYKKEGIDEMAEYNLKRCDAICFKLFIVAMIAVAWVCGVVGHLEINILASVGWVIVLTILALTVIRTILFTVMDRKGV